MISFLLLSAVVSAIIFDFINSFLGTVNATATSV